MARKRDRREIVRSKWRVQAEEPVPVARLCHQAQASSQALIRWITEGKRGVFMDGVKLPGLGWCSSPAALIRFREAVNLSPTPAA